MNDSAPARRAPRLWWIAAAFAAVATLVYGRALSGEFVWDDIAHVTAPALRSLEGLGRIWTDVYATQQYYPLLHSAFWLQHQLWGDAVLGYHLLNVVLHALAAVLFGAVLRELRVPAGWLAAAVFLVHPVHVESVAWISELKNTLSATLYLGAFWSYWRFGEARNRRYYFAATALFIAALLTKTVTATLPAALLVVIWWRRGALDWRRDVVPLLPWFAVGISAGLFTAWVERALIGASGAEFELSLAQRVCLAGRVVTFYFAKLLWPANLAFIYPRWTIDPSTVGAWLPLAAVTATLWACWRWRHGTRAPLAVMLLFCGTLVPVLGFLNVYPFRYSFVADHFQYLASMAVLAGLAGAGAQLGRRARGPLIAAGLLAFAAMAHVQCAQYRDLETLWRVTLARNPSASIAWVNLGQLRSKAGRHDEALRYFRRAAELNPQDWDALNNIGCELVIAGKPAEARPYLERALALNPISADVHNNLGYALARSGERRAAMEHYRKALQARPEFADARNNLGVALTEEGRAAEAMPHLEKALALSPSDARTHHNFANALRALGRLPEAIAAYQQALRLNPNLAETHDDLGVTFLAVGRPDAAIAEFQAALRVQPDMHTARNHLAQALAQAGRWLEALDQFDAAVRAEPSSAALHLNRGLVLAALDRWTEACDAFRQVVRLDPESDAGRRNLGMALANTGDTPGALEFLESAVRLRPDSAENHVALAQLLEALGRSAAAADHRSRAEALQRERRE